MIELIQGGPNIAEGRSVDSFTNGVFCGYNRDCPLQWYNDNYGNSQYEFYRQTQCSQYTDYRPRISNGIDAVYEVVPHESELIVDEPGETPTE